LQEAGKASVSPLVTEHRADFRENRIGRGVEAAALRQVWFGRRLGRRTSPSCAPESGSTETSRPAIGHDIRAGRAADTSTAMRPPRETTETASVFSTPAIRRRSRAARGAHARSLGRAASSSAWYRVSRTEGRQPASLILPVRLQSSTASGNRPLEPDSNRALAAECLAADRSRRGPALPQ